MSADRHAKVKAIFIEACALPPDKRSAFLSHACGNDADLRGEVDRLLSHHGAAGKAPLSSRASDPDGETVVTDAAADFEPPHYSTGHLIADRYRIVALLGEGGMGRVYRAEDLRLNLTVALKFMPRFAGLDPIWRRRIESEVKLSRSVGHSNVCRVFDLGEIDGIPFISMEFVEGEDLASLLRRIGRVNNDRAIAIARQLCAGLAASHTQGVLHRDLKPSNIMLDAKGDVRITDFGLAVAAGRMDRKEMPAGTPRYMAPELFAGVPATEKSDIYALGLVLYELFTGKPAFTAKGPAEYSRLHRTEEPAVPSTITPDIDLKVEADILACLRKVPEERPVSVLHVAAGLPGGDLLAAALAAGAIPTREMLAAAAAKGEVSRRGLSRMAIIGAGLLITAIALGIDTHPITKHGGAKSPEVLREQARAIAGTAGLTTPPVDTDFRFLSTTEVELGNGGNSPQSFSLAGAKDATFFCYRESRSGPLPRDVDLLLFIMPGTEPFRFSPSAAGVTTVILDGSGKLVYFESNDKSGRITAEPNAGTGLDSLIQASGNDARNLIIIPSSIPSSAARWNFLKTTRNTVLLILLAVAIPGAWRSWRSGGDLVGAVRVGGFVFALRLVGSLLVARRAGVDTETIDTLARTLASSLAEAAIVLLFYLALERHVRRLWPRTLGCWSRMLTGTIRDPFVGRDVLIGCVFGYYFAIISFLDRRLPTLMGWETRSQLRVDQSLNHLLGVRSAIAGAMESVRNGIYQGMVVLCVLVLATRLAGGRKWLALGITWLVSSLMYAPAATHPVNAWTFYAFGVIAVALYVLLHWGVVSLLAALLVLELIGVFPITFDTSSWYAGYGLFGIAAALGVAIWGFHQSRRPILPTSPSLS